MRRFEPRQRRGVALAAAKEAMVVKLRRLRMRRERTSFRHETALSLTVRVVCFRRL